LFVSIKSEGTRRNGWNIHLGTDEMYENVQNLLKYLLFVKKKGNLSLK